MLSSAARAGDLEGVIQQLVEGGLTHLQYADDTIIFLKKSDTNIRNLKFILFCFEAMSGMKINFDKSEVFAVGIEPNEKQQIAEIFGCKVGSFPITYLGLPVSDCKLSKEQLSFVGDKIKRRLELWKGDTLSSGGKAVLIESCLSSIPMYTMGVYILYEGNYQVIDAIRSKFFLAGDK